MPLFDNVYQRIIQTAYKHPRLSAAVLTIGLACATTIGLTKGLNKLGSEVYRCKIGDEEVIYKEGVYSYDGASKVLIPFELENRMEIKYDHGSWIFIDWEHERSIKDTAINGKPFQDQHLEKIIFRCGKGADSIETELLKGEHGSSEIFKSFDGFYNQRLKEITNKLNPYVR